MIHHAEKQSKETPVLLSFRVQIKYIADPSMHSMPAVTPNPAGTAIICQSLDNQVGAQAWHDVSQLV